MKKVLTIIGARPQFIKHAPIDMVFKDKFELISVHTGQHYDENMSKVFFEELNISTPDYMLSLGGGCHGEQTGRMLIEVEKILQKENPDAIIVYGDTNTTIAASLAGAKLHIPIIHIEAGLRSFNKKMPEEINRILTDHISSVLIAPTSVAIENLKNEGITENCYKTGDVMKDMIYIAKKHNILTGTDNSLNYIYVTIHRPYNTDDKNRLQKILTELNNLGQNIIFSRHPRTKKLMEQFELTDKDFQNIEFISPLSYFENLSHMFNASAIITDSGGMQKEAYVLKKKCITIRTETEWTETLKGGWNILLFDNLYELKDKLSIAPNDSLYDENLYGNGEAAKEIFEILSTFLNKK